MNDLLLDDSINPRFVHFTTVHRAELDGVDRLPKSALAAHIEGAIQAWYRASDVATTAGDIHIEYLEPVVGAQTLRIDLWVEHLDDSTCTYGFFCSSENGNMAFARGERTLVKADRANWSEPFRARNAELLKNLPAYA